MQNFLKRNYIYIIIFIYSFVFALLSKMNMDLMWNYGFSANISNGLLPYKDFYMVITPFFPFIVGNIMKIIGTNFITFYLINSCLITFFMYIISKLNKNIMIPMFLAIMFVCEPNYNLMCIIFLFLILYLEKKKSNDYLIGFILGLCFLTKSSIGLMMCIPTIIHYYKDLKKIFKRVIGFIIPNLIVILYFLIKKNLYSYLNLCFFGLFDFANSNSHLTIYLFLTIIVIIYFIYRYIKTKDLLCLYIIFYQINTYPMFNTIHFMASMIPVIFYLLNLFFKKKNKLLNIFSLSLFLIPITFMIFYLVKPDINYPKNTLFQYRYIEDKYYDRIKALDKYFEGNYDNVYFMVPEAYLYKYYFELDVNEFDLLVVGNMGYDGENEMIKKIKELPKGSIFVVDYYFAGGIRSEKIYKHLVTNYSLVAAFDIFNVYKKM